MPPKTSKTYKEERVEDAVRALEEQWGKSTGACHLLGGSLEEQSLWTDLMKDTLGMVKSDLVAGTLVGTLSEAQVPRLKYTPKATRSTFGKWHLISTVTDADKEWVPKGGKVLPSRELTFSKDDVPVAVAEDGATTIRWKKETFYPYNRVFKVPVDSGPVTKVTIPYGKAEDTGEEDDSWLNTAQEWVRGRWFIHLDDISLRKSSEIIKEGLASLKTGLRETQHYLQSKAETQQVDGTQATCLLRAGCGRITLPNGSQEVVLPVWQIALEPDGRFPRWTVVASSTRYPQSLLTSGNPESKDTEMDQGP